MFADTDGSLVDVYQAAAQLTDESDQDIPTEIAVLLDNAIGAKGYYAVVTANMHTDTGEADTRGREHDRRGRAECRRCPADGVLSLARRPRGVVRSPACR